MSEAVAELELDEPMVVGVARGGVAVAIEVARELKAPLTAIDVERVNARGLRLGVVDDGLITVLTLAAACRWARAEGAAQLIAATPVGHVGGLARLRVEADVVVCPHPLEEIAVVGQAYDIFDPLDEWYVAGLLADAAARSD